jgi:predicted PurR-regulated permease PerM
MVATIGAGAIVGTSIAELRSAMPAYQERLDAMFKSAGTRLSSYGISTEMLRLEEVLDPGSLMRSFVGGLLSVASFASDSLIVLFTMILMLFEASYFDRKLRAMMKEGGDTRAFVYHQVAEKVQKYMALKALVSLATGLLVTVLLKVVGVDLAVLWGFVAFLLNFIPNLGSIIAAVPAVLLALIQLGPGAAIVVALGYLAINVLMGSIIELRLMGQTLGLSTLVVFLSLLFWGWLWGTVGALLSIPLTMIVKILLESNPATRRVAIVLSDSASVERMLAADRAEDSAEA